MGMIYMVAQTLVCDLDVRLQIHRLKSVSRAFVRASDYKYAANQ